MRLIVAISGATGVIMGYELLKVLKNIKDCEVHLIISEGAQRNFELETDLDIAQVKALADHYHDNTNLAAAISSGSFKTDGMIILPCSMKSLSGIAHGYADNLLVRAADVCLKENRHLVIVPREMPLGKIHLKNMLLAAELGCSIVPPMLTFYNAPDGMQSQITHLIGKILMQFGIDTHNFKPWQGA